MSPDKIEQANSPPSNGMHLAACNIPYPLSISEQARAALAIGAAREPTVSPEVTDIAGWRAFIEAMNARVEPYLDAVLSSLAVDVEVQRTGDIDVYVVKRKDLPAADWRKVNFFLHGGGWVAFGGRLAVLPAAVAAAHYGGVVYAPDYRMPPDHPFPTALNDCLRAYQDVLLRFNPESMLVSGESAGGNLAAALMHRARDIGLPQPGALYLNTPVLDLTNASDSLATNRGLDVVLGEGAGKMAELYRNGADPCSPYLSPLLGDLGRGFPKTYLRSGTRDLLLSESVRMHAALRKAGVESDLYVGEAMPHGGFAIFGTETPEDVDARNDLVRWLARHWH